MESWHDGFFSDRASVVGFVGPRGIVNHQTVEVLHHMVVGVDWFVGLGVEAVPLNFPQGAVDSWAELDTKWVTLIKHTLQVEDAEVLGFR